MSRITNQIAENSLYTTPTELADLLKDKEKVASAFFINFLGTLGLFAISSTRGIMKNYFPGDGKLQIVNIGDANKDTSLATKLYHDIGGLKPDTTNKITRLLFKLKSRAITSKNFDENIVRDLIKEIQYLTHRPHPVILNVVKQFESGAANIKQVAKAFYTLIKARKKDFGPISQEFYDIARQYQIYLKDIADIGSAPAAAVSTAAISTSVPHSTDGTAAVTPVSAAVNQKPEANKIQTVAKPAAVSDEDFYLMLWKASSGREITKLLKERGHTDLSGDLLKNAVNYLIPSLNDREEHFKMIMSVMPGIETFNKAFGYFMKKDVNFENRWRMILLYKVAMGKNAAEIKAGLSAARLPLRKLFSTHTATGAINGKTRETLKRMVFDVVINEFQRKIVSAGPTDDIDTLFELFSKELNSMDDTFRESSWRGDLASFTSGSTLTEKEKLKYLIAFLSKTRTGLTNGIRALQILLKSQGVEFTESLTGNSKTTLIQKYDNLFPNSKELIDKWYADVDHNHLRFGSVDAYEEIIQEWKTGYIEDVIKDNIIHIPETESVEEIADKIVKGIDALAGPEDQKILFDNYAIQPGMGSTNWYGELTRAAKVARLIQITYAKRFKTAIENGSFKIGPNQTIDRYISDFFALAISDFRKNSSRIDQSQWDAYVAVMKALFAKNEDFQEPLLLKALNYGDGAEKMLPWVNADRGRLIRLIIDKGYTKKTYPIMILTDFSSAQYLKDEDYKNLALAIAPETFIELAVNHKIDPYKYLPYEVIKEYVVKYLKDNYSSIINSKAFKQTFERLNEKDKEEQLDYLKNNIFRKSAFSNGLGGVNQLTLKRFAYLVGKERTDAYLNSLGAEEKKVLLVSASDFFFESMTASNMNETIPLVLDDPLWSKHVLKDVLIDHALKRKDELTLEVAKKLTDFYSRYDRGLKPSVRREFEHMYFGAIEILLSKSKDSADDIYLQMPLNERRSLVGYIIDRSYMADALRKVQGDDVPIKPLTPVTEERLVQILKYNDIQTPRRPIVKEKDKLSEVISKTVVTSPINDLHVDNVDLDDETLERMSVEYDAFNRYAHGENALKIKRAFNVSIPLQEEGFKRWMQKMADEGIDPKVMKPIFHGTGSIGASMILRYGFKVIKSNDPSVVGRMLGDGIYFSNVLDKVAQYIGDEGFTRRHGTQGYIFEMEGSLGMHRRDYRCAGTGAKEDERDTVSPEWAVFNPNEQLRIYKAYHVEIIDKAEMDKMKAKHLGTNESTAVEIKSFKEFINEGTGDMPHCITYIFMDGNIPISEKQAVDFKDFQAKKMGRNVRLDWTGSGPAVMIYNRKESKTYVVRYTREFMENREGVLTDYLKLIKK